MHRDMTGHMMGGAVTPHTPAHPAMEVLQAVEHPDPLQAGAARRIHLALGRGAGRLVVCRRAPVERDLVKGVRAAEHEERGGEGGRRCAVWRAEGLRRGCTSEQSGGGKQSVGLRAACQDVARFKAKKHATRAA